MQIKIKASLDRNQIGNALKRISGIHSAFEGRLHKAFKDNENGHIEQQPLYANASSKQQNKLALQNLKELYALSEEIKYMVQSLRRGLK